MPTEQVLNNTEDNTNNTINTNQPIKSAETMTTELKKETVNVCYTLQTNKPESPTYEELYNKLKKSYRRKQKEGIMCYEYYNANIEMIKPHIDYEEYADLETFCLSDEQEIADKLEEVLCRIFNADVSDFAISSDTRRTLKKVGYNTVFFQSPTEYFENRRGLANNIGFNGFFALEQMSTDGFELVNYFGYEDNIMLEPSREWLAKQESPFLEIQL